jgi:hypothetical protein
VGLELAIEGGSTDSEQANHLGQVTVRFHEGLLDGLLLELLEVESVEAV